MTDVSVGLRPPWFQYGWDQHGVSIQISIKLGKKFIRISCIRKIALTRILVGVFAYLPSLISQILILFLIYFEWRDTENQQFILWKKFRSRTLITTFAMDKGPGLINVQNCFLCRYLFSILWVTFYILYWVEGMWCPLVYLQCTKRKIFYFDWARKLCLL